MCPQNQENENIFDLLYAVLQNLAKEKQNPANIHAFEVELLTLLGYYSEGTHDLKGSKASYFIESILERKLKSRQIIPHLS